jgi:peptidylprolyl isomerase
MGNKNVVKEGDKVAITYVGILDSGLYFDISHEKSPYVYIVGSDRIFPAFDRHLIGMKVGEEKRFRLLAEEAYGEVNGDLLIEVPLENLPRDLHPQVGMQLHVPLSALKKPYPFKITRVGEVSISLNANHPLAGRDLTFEVKLIAIKHPKKKKTKE